RSPIGCKDRQVRDSRFGGQGDEPTECEPAVVAELRHGGEVAVGLSSIIEGGEVDRHAVDLERAVPCLLGSELWTRDAPIAGVGVGGEGSCGEWLCAKRLPGDAVVG